MTEKEKFLARFDLDIGHHYDITGAPISMGEWAWRFEDRNYQGVLKTEKRGILVSTVWLGLDHGWGGPVPIIFETMIFGLKTEKYEYQERYATLDQAIVGHEQACKYAFGWRTRLREALWCWRPDIPMPPIWRWAPPSSHAQPWDSDWEITRDHDALGT